MCTSSLTIYCSLFSCYLCENQNHQGLVTDSRTPMCFPDVAKSDRCLDSSFPSPLVILDDINHQVQLCNGRFLVQNHICQNCFQPPVGHWERMRSEKSAGNHHELAWVRFIWPLPYPPGASRFACKFKLHHIIWSLLPSIVFCPKMWVKSWLHVT